MNDMGWLDDYLKKEEEFNIFYSENVSNVSAIFIYIKNNDIINIKKQKINVSNNCLKKEKILEYVKKNKKDNKLIKILKYNFNVTPEQIKKYVVKENFTFLKNYDKIEDIYWEKTIPLFNSLNSLYFLFMKKSDKTRKIILTNKSKTRKKKFSNNDLKLSVNDYNKIENKIYFKK